MEAPNLSKPSQNTAINHLSRRLETELQNITRYFEGLAGEQWQIQVYSEGSSWRVAQVLGHMITSERALRRLIEAILEGGSGAPEDFDIDRFNESQVRKLEADPPADPLQALAEERRRTLDYLATLDPGSLAVEGRHPYFGEITIHKLFKWIYQHARGHLREIQDALSSPGR
jgi:uncharacterized protein (TIGR03083 family)